jgi:polyisoprenoid-binding protein YceI
MTELLVYTFKQGLLSRVAHDLKLVAEQVEVSQEGGRVEVWVAADSLRVRCAMKNGREDHRALSEDNRLEIENLISQKILRVEHHPHIRYSGVVRGEQAVGTLTMCGVSQPLVLPWLDGHGEVLLDQRRFGISPYRAMMGALKLKPQLKIVWWVRTSP